MRPLKVLLVGVGTVGEAIAVVSRDRPWIETMVLSDYDLDRARRVQARLGGAESGSAAATRFPVERIDARDRAQVVTLARKHKVDNITIHLRGTDTVHPPVMIELGIPRITKGTLVLNR